MGVHVGEWVCVGTRHQGGRRMGCAVRPSVVNPGACVSGLSPEAQRTPGGWGCCQACADVLGRGRGAAQALTWLGRLAHPEWHL